MPFKCPHLGKIVTSFIEIVQRGCDQPLDTLPDGLVVRSAGVRIINLQIHLVGVYILVGS